MSAMHRFRHIDLLGLLLAALWPFPCGAQVWGSPQAAVATDRVHYVPCDTFAPWIHIQPGTENNLVDGWVWIVFPDGPVAFLEPDLKTFSWTPAPTAPNFTVGYISDVLLQMHVPPNLAAGTYMLHVAGVMPGTHPFDPSYLVTNVASTQMSFTIPEATGVYNGTATLSWTPPTTYVDGTALLDLAGYRIYFGTTQGCHPSVIDIPNPGITAYVIENLAPNVYYFVVTAYTASSLESAPSNEASTAIAN